MSTSSAKKDRKAKKKKKDKKNRKDNKHTKEKKKKKKDKKRDKGDKGDKAGATSSSMSSGSAAAPAAAAHPHGRISRDDYFRKATEFRIWLRRAVGKEFEDLETTEARALFEDFVVKWNAGTLSKSVYVPTAAGKAASSRTQFAWGFKDTLSVRDQGTLDTLRHSVSVANQAGGTVGAEAAGMAVGKRKTGPTVMGPQRPSKAARSGGGAASTSTAQSRRQQILSRAAAADAAEDKRMAAFKKAMGLA